MAIPRVAIVGRPNVGKSSLLNWLAGRRISIVDPTAGVTRDRVTALVDADGRYFELIDTGGMGIEDCDNLTAEVEKQIQSAIDQADVILFVVDTRAGVMPLDEEVGRRLRYLSKPVIGVANKCDTPELDDHAADFFTLGRGKMVCVSADQKRGKDALLNAIVKELPADQGIDAPRGPDLKLAIVGRRNTGKSTFINALAEAERVIVSEVAGTTRDSVDVRFERDGKVFVAIDTAGVRRKTSISSSIEFYSMARSERSIRRADVVLLFFDPRTRVSKVDKALAEYVLTEHKPAVFVVNKWDLMKAMMPTERFATYLRATFPMLDYVPIAFITAKNGKNVQSLLNLSQTLFKQSSTRVGTGDLNRVLRQAVDENPPPMRQNRRAKIYFATQVDVNPPTVVVFTNGPQLFDNTYQRYLVKYFRDNLPFNDIPIKMYLRSRSREDAVPVDGEKSVASTQPQAKTPDVSKLSFKSRAGDKDDKDFNADVWRDL